MKKTFFFVLVALMLMPIEVYSSQNPSNLPPSFSTSATNRLIPVDQSIWLDNLKFKAVFHPGGIGVSPRQSPLTWYWDLNCNNGEDVPVVFPTINNLDNKQVIDYIYPILTERYVIKNNSIEQQFILSESPEGDLELIGNIHTEGHFSTSSQNWEWTTANGGRVTLGDLYVYDANGQEIPAQFSVQAFQTKIFIKKSDLEKAAYPITLDPEIGADFRISRAGDLADYDADKPAIAFNSTDKNYLLVWHADVAIGNLVDGELEIYGRILDTEGVPASSSYFQISQNSPSGDADYDATLPDVAYDFTNNEFLVVWQADIDMGSLVEGEFEIYGRIVQAEGTMSANPFRISTMGLDGSPNTDASAPKVIYNKTRDKYFVVWYGDETVGPTVDGEFEVYGQLVNRNSTLHGNRLRLTSVGTDGDADRDATYPTIAYNLNTNSYLLAYNADDPVHTADGEQEVYVQLLDGNEQLLGNPIRISDSDAISPTTTYLSGKPQISLDNNNNRFLVVWENLNVSSGTNTYQDVWGRLLDNDGSPLIAQFRISFEDDKTDETFLWVGRQAKVVFSPHASVYLVVYTALRNGGGADYELMGQFVSDEGTLIEDKIILTDMPGEDEHSNYDPALAYNPTNEEFLVTGRYDEMLTNYPLYNASKGNIYGHRVNTNMQLLDNYIAEVEMGTEGDDIYDAEFPAIAYSPEDNEFLVVWEGNDNTNTLAQDEMEIFGRFWDGEGFPASHPFRVSEMGPDKNTNYEASQPAVIYDPNRDYFLVAWRGDTEDMDEGLVDNEFEIFTGRVLTSFGASGVQRVSYMGPDGNTSYEARRPSIAYNSTDEEYLVVWAGDNTNDEYEIWGQLMSEFDMPIGDNFLISTHNAAIAGLNRFEPDVAYNAHNNKYLVVWSGEMEIQGKSVIAGSVVSADGSTITPINDIGIMDDPNNTNFDAFAPAVAASTVNDRFVVVWQGDQTAGNLVNNKYEIYANYVNAGGTLTTSSPIRVSYTQPDNNAAYNAFYSDIAYDSDSDDYAVVWIADDPEENQADNEFEVWMSYLNTIAVPHAGDLRLSDMGPSLNANYNAQYPAVAYNSVNKRFLAVWQGDDSSEGLVEGEFEIHGQFFTNSSGALPLEWLSFNAWKVKNGIELKWSTSEENNISHFQILRSREGEEWTTIGSVMAQNDKDRNEYSFLDKNPLEGMNYYLLQQWEEDGKFDFSEVVSVVWESGKEEIAAYPNPAKEVLHIDWGDRMAERLYLYDVRGRLRKTFEASSILHLGNLGSGVYWLRSGDGGFSKQIVVN